MRIWPASEWRSDCQRCRLAHGAPMSELLTVAQVAFVLKCSEDTVVGRLERRSGVLDLGTANNGRRNGRYRVLRIPKTVVENYLVARRSAAANIEVPPSPK